MLPGIAEACKTGWIYELDRNTVDFDLHLAPDCWDDLPVRLSQTRLSASRHPPSDGPSRPPGAWSRTSTSGAPVSGWARIPAIVRSAVEDEAYLLMIVENLQRRTSVHPSVLFGPAHWPQTWPPSSTATVGALQLVYRRA